MPTIDPERTKVRATLDYLGRGVYFLMGVAAFAAYAYADVKHFESDSANDRQSIHNDIGIIRADAVTRAESIAEIKRAIEAFQQSEASSAAEVAEMKREIKTVSTELHEMNGYLRGKDRSGASSPIGATSRFSQEDSSPKPE